MAQYGKGVAVAQWLRVGLQVNRSSDGSHTLGIGHTKFISLAHDVLGHVHHSTAVSWPKIPVISYQKLHRQNI